jgi:ATP-dependent DNA helicase RecG
MAALADSVRYLHGVGPEMSRRLSKLGIDTVRDLLFHIPVGYRDRSEISAIARLSPGSEASVLAGVTSVSLRRLRGRRDVHATLRDESGFVQAVWFNQPHLESSLRVGQRYLFSGAVEAFRGLEFQNPDFEPEERAEGFLHVGRVVPRYALTAGITERWIRARVRAALDELEPVLDLVPEEWRSKIGVPELREAMERVHYPHRVEDAEPARRRMALEEILALQISLQYARRSHRHGRRAPSLARGSTSGERFVASLPFAPTAAQSRAIAAIGSDLDQTVPMRRLLLGDVGSGKTVVALAAALRAVGAGHQAAILTPTSILAEQHAATASRLLEGLGVTFGLRTASTPPKERDRLAAGFASGEISIAIGTHALLERDLAFRSLALVVVDEQHRFGVRQRVTLTEGRDGASSAHLLVLTATPIPRSLAMTLYGDLDLTLLDEKPPGRVAVETLTLDGGRPGALVELLRDEVAGGGSAFVVYPVVEESETMDLKAATAMAGKLAAVSGLASAGVALVHGRLKSEARREAIARFRSGEVRILVATTVVEVGLDIPDATLVAIEHPERFGLAQLHQLRGRVGRSDRAGRCVLVVGRDIGEVARRRLNVFRTVHDGFRLAEEDLRLRGPGKLLGTVQHGFPELRAADPMRDQDLIEAGRDWAVEILKRGEAEEGERLKAWIEAHFPGAAGYLGSG